MSRYIGVDLHKNSFFICIYKPMEEVYEKKKYHMTELNEFQSILLKSDEVALEATGNTRYFVEQIKELVKKVVVVNPVEFKVVSSSTKKTDAHDATSLALYLSKGLLPEVNLKSEEVSQINSLINTCDKLVKLRTVLKNKVHNILNSYGYVTKKEMLSSDVGLKEVEKYRVSEVAKLELSVIVEQIKSLNKSISRLEKEIEKKGKGLKGYENITSIKGIGSKSGTIMLSVIGDINNFDSHKNLASYFGIVPKVKDSNETIKHGRITKKGSKIGRTTLVQCTLVTIRYSGYLRAFYERIKGKKGAGKAIIATARKFLNIIYMTLKNNLIFEDFPNFIYRQNTACI